MSDDLGSGCGAMVEAWLRWGNLVLGVLWPFLVVGAVAGFDRAIARAVSALGEGAPWTERARVAWPFRRGRNVGVAFACLFAPATAFLFVGPLSVATAAVLAALLAFGTWGVVAASSRRGRSTVTPEGSSVGADLGASMGLVAIVAPQLFVALAAFTVVVTARTTMLAWLAIFVTALVTAAGVKGGGVALARTFGIVRDASPDVRRRIEALAMRRGLTRAPRVFVMRVAVANAYALVFARSIGFTEGALRILDPDELDAVALHELAHLDEPAPIRRTRLVATSLPVVLVALPAIMHEFGGFGVLGAVVAVFVIVRVNRRAASSAEHHADEGARDGADPKVYGRALEKLYQHNATPAVLRNRVHPSLYDRLLASGITPAYPRPLPPRHNGGRYLAPLVLVALALTMGRIVTGATIEHFPPTVGLIVAGVIGANDHELARLATTLAPHDTACADALFVAATE